MKTEYLLYGLAKGETCEGMESILLHTINPIDIPKAKKLATADGWHSFRVAEYKGEAPDFTDVLTK
jgi:hypothetical protein